MGVISAQAFLWCQPLKKIPLAVISPQEMISVGAIFTLIPGRTGLFGWNVFSVYILSRLWASSLHIGSRSWTILKSGNHSYQVALK